MPTDFSLDLRQSVVKALKADPGVTALVSADRIYGEKSPAARAVAKSALRLTILRMSSPEALQLARTGAGALWTRLCRR